jgi:anti-sigma regulatory factor (Ser/Thr protein kinase)
VDAIAGVERLETQAHGVDTRRPRGSAVKLVRPVTFDLRNDLDELQKLTVMLARCGAQLEIPENFVRQLELALDEIITNIISYGYADDAEHLIRVEVLANAGDITAVVQDDGVPFNPLERPVPDTTLGVEERGVGGLGIHLVRELMDHLHYERVGAFNRLTIVKTMDGTRRSGAS